MKKVVEKVKVLIAILLVIFVSIVAFWGIFKKENGVWKNVVPDYNYGMDIEGARELVYALDNTEEEKYVYVDDEGNIKGEVWKDGSSITEEEDNAEEDATEENSENADSEATEEVEETENSEEEKEEDSDVPYAKETRTIKVNKDEDLTKGNFETAKKIIQKRLNAQDLGEYDIRIDDVTGKLVIENANNQEQVDAIDDIVANTGKFQIVDYQNGVVLMDNSDIKAATVVYSNDDMKYNTYLQIEFNEAGTEKLREMSTKYVETTVESESSDEENTDDEETEEEPETERKMVTIKLDTDTLMTTYFGEEMTNGVIQIPVGQERTDYEEFVKDHDDAQVIADTLNSGVLPITYTLETDNFVKSDITKSKLQKIGIVQAVVFGIISIVYLMKFKKNGLLATILNIGYIALFALVAKYTNAQITITSMVAGFLTLLMNYIFVYNYLKELNQTEKTSEAYIKTSKRFYLTILPVMIIAIVFTLMESYVINSIGMVVFWGLILNIVYNLIFTKTLIKRED